MTKILIIEDETPLLEEIVDILTFEGYLVVTADNGKTGIERALHHLPDLIICDIMMPESDGYEVLEALQESHHTQSIPFIFLTAKADKNDQRDGMNLGADDYLTKPFEADELLNSVEARLNRATRFVDSSERKAQVQREKLIRHISHELKNPLTAMQMASSLIQKYIGAKAFPNLDVWLEASQAGSSRMKHLVEQMLIESSLESGNLNKEAIQQSAKLSPLWAVMPSVIEQGRKFARDNSELEIRLRMGDETAQIVCDIDLMRHALSEIIANALDFSPAKEYVVIDQWVADDLAVISIIDMGPGMSESAIKHALMPFTQANMVETSKKGLGLGLSLANQIIQLHGGTLDVMSKPDEGTTVVIRLPYIA